MTLQIAYLAIQCTAHTDEVGTYLYSGEHPRTGELRSPVLSDSVALYQWLDANGWKREPYDRAHPCGVYSKAPVMVPQQCQQQQARANPTPDVSSRYGAPMGRQSATFANLDPAERLYLSRVPLNSGGYDAGGAYWGIGAPLWCVMDHTNECAYFRARDRAAAKAHVIANHDTPDQVRFYR